MRVDGHRMQLQDDFLVKNIQWAHKMLNLKDLPGSLTKEKVVDALFEYQNELISIRVQGQYDMSGSFVGYDDNEDIEYEVDDKYF